ncbi:hypothetical protein EKI60_05230 [Candidatus Saccharibacteria bacterium]|nr:MAG: hypothetical protein EKI60_05230 [Candidatus Saccharibacteria bacterium]
MYQICVSAAAKGKSVEDGRLLAEAAGLALAKSGHSLMTGATVGLPNIAAESYKKNNGHMSLGISPASSKIEHVMKYRLPTEAYDVILYSGLNYVGRDALLIASSDAVLSIGGRIGTLHEFTIAMETETPIGFIQGAGGISSEIMDIMHAAGKRSDEDVIFGDSAEEVLEKLVQLLNKRNKKYAHLYK